MRLDHPDAEVESYLKKAERDFKTALRMSESGPDYSDIVASMRISAPKKH